MTMICCWPTRLTSQYARFRSVPALLACLREHDEVTVQWTPVSVGPATAANVVTTPSQLCANSVGTIYLVESIADVIRKVSTSGILSAFVGGASNSNGRGGDNGPATSALVDGPNACAVDSSGDVYFADFQNNVVRKVTVSDGKVVHFAGTGDVLMIAGLNGPLTASTLKMPKFVFIDTAGSFFVSEHKSRIRKSVLGSGLMTTYAG